MLYGYTRLHLHIQNESRVKLSSGTKGITERGEIWEAGGGRGRDMPKVL